MQMKRKTLAILILLGIGVIVGPGMILILLTRFYERDSQKMITHLSDRYGLIFPKSVTAVKGATAILDASGNSWFLMKFQIKPEEINDFLANYEETINSLPTYSLASDSRLRVSYPRWYKTPIKSGRIGYLSKQAKGIKGISFDFYLFIDLSQSNSVVVYMEGFYKSEEDNL